MVAVEPPIVELAPLGRVIGTRDLAKRVIAEHPEVNPGLAVYVDCRWVVVMSSPFVNEVLDAWPFAAPLGAGRHVADVWAAVHETREGAK